ncbi:MAG TPA: methyltransferase domain-containing protein [Bacilli bacterium]|nr:methyltransferase domain-containing protein [Bacilli bacterium]
MSELNYHDLLASFGIGGAHPGGFAMTREVLQEAGLTASTHLLDVGCGTGQSAAYIAKRYGCAVTGLDRHPLMLEKAERRMRREGLAVRLVQGDAHALPFADQTFDVVLSESVTIFTDLNTTLQEYARVLKPNGVLLDLSMTAERPLSAQELGELRAVYGTKIVPTEAEWCGRLQKVGFAKVDVLKKGTVASAVPGPQATPGELPEFDPSPDIDPELFAIWERHQALTERFSRRLGYRVYCATRRQP